MSSSIIRIDDGFSASANLINSQPMDVGEFRDAYFFHVSRERQYSEMWITNGRRSKLISVGNLELENETPVLIRGKALIGSDTLVATDGTPAGTISLGVRKDSSFVTNAVHGYEAVKLGNQVYFVGSTEAGDEIFSTDGTPKGTRQLTTVHAEMGLNPYQAILGMRLFNQKLVFVVDYPNNETSPDQTYKVIQFDPANSRMKVIAELHPHPEGGHPKYYEQELKAASILDTDGQLWVHLQSFAENTLVHLDGTSDGGQLLKFGLYSFDHDVFARDGFIICISDISKGVMKLRGSSVKRIPSFVTPDTGDYAANYYARTGDQSVYARFINSSRTIWLRIDGAADTISLISANTLPQEIVNQAAGLGTRLELSRSSSQVRITSGGSEIIPWINLPDVKRGSIQGLVFEDQNRDGIRQDSEPFIKNALVSAREKHVVDPTAPMGASMDADENGRFFLTRLSTPQAVLIAEVPDFAAVQTTGSLIRTVRGTIVDAVIGIYIPRGTGVIKGHLFLDMDMDGVQDRDEPPLADRVVYSDLSSNQRLNKTNEPFAITDFNGDFVLRNLIAMRQTLRVVRNKSEEFLETTVTPFTPRDQHTSVVRLGLFQDGREASISGRAYVDMNDDGKNETNDDQYLVGAEIVLTRVRTGQTWTSFSHVRGEYRFTGLRTGQYALQVAFSRNGRPFKSVVTLVDVFPDHSVISHLRVSLPYIRGRVFADVNNDGVAQNTERGHSNVPIYLDLNQNGRRDDDETEVFSDSNGRYSFRALVPGNYTIAIDDRHSRYASIQRLSRTVALNHSAVANLSIYMPIHS